MSFLGHLFPMLNPHAPLSSHRPLFLDLWPFTLSHFNSLLLARVFIEAWKWTQLFLWGGHQAWSGAAGRSWSISHILRTQPLQNPILCPRALFPVCPSLCTLLLPAQPVPPTFSHLRAAFGTDPPQRCLCVDQGPTPGYTSCPTPRLGDLWSSRWPLGMTQCRRQVFQGSVWTQSLYY